MALMLSLPIGIRQRGHRSSTTTVKVKKSPVVETKGTDIPANIPSVFKGGMVPIRFHRYTNTGGVHKEPLALISEGFEDTVPPAGWQVQSQQTADSTWHQDSRWSHSGTYSALVWWSYQDQNEWLITPEVELTGSPTGSYYFSFWTFAHKGSTYGDHYYVLMTTDHGATWDTLLDFSSYTAPDTGWVDTQYVFDISSYAGDTVQFAFQAVATGGLWYIWGIDDVSILAPYTHDVAVLQITSPSSDTITTGTYPLRALFKNKGLSVDTFTARMVLDSESVTVRDTSFELVLAPGEVIDTSFGEYDFNVNGAHYTLTVYADFSDDQETSDNQLSVNLYVFNPHSGGPDGFGYTFMDSDYPTGPAFNWIDPTSGTEITLQDDDTVTIGLPFHFRFYDAVIDSIILSSNGFLSTYSNGTGLSNRRLPDTTRENIIAVWWDDLNPSAQGNVYYYVPGDSSYAVIAFVNVPHYGSTDGNTFEVVLYPNGNILMQYQHVGSDYATSSTIGIQGGHGYNEYYLLYTYNGEPVIPHDSLAILFTYPVYNYQVALVNITEPFQYLVSSDTNPRIDVTIGNFGVQPVTNVPIVLEVWHDATLVTQLTDQFSVDSFSTTVKSFELPLSLLTVGKYDIVVYHQLSTDERPSDDTIKTTVYLTNRVVNFENGYPQFVFHGGWEWGEPTYENAPTAYSGRYLVGTVLNGNYEDSANYIMDRKFVVTGANPVLLFYHWYDAESRYDGGNVKISTDGGSTFTILTPVGGYPYDSISQFNAGIPNEPAYSGHAKKWELAVFPIHGCNVGDTVIIRWQFGSDRSINYAGWYIDDISGIDFEPYYPEHDLAVVNIAPEGVVEANSYFIPQITVTNQGTNDDNVVLVAIVDSEGVNIQGQTFQFQLASLTSRTIYLDPVFTGDPGVHYHVKVRIIPVDGEDTTNNYLEKAFVSAHLLKEIRVPVAIVSPDIDGTIKEGEWDDAISVDISDVYGQAGNARDPLTATLYMKLDTVLGRLFVAVTQKADSSLDDYDQIGLFFDDNNDGLFPAPGNNSEGNYWVVYHPTGVSFVYRPLYSDGTYGDTVPMTAARAISLDNGVVTYEVEIPLGTLNEYLGIAPHDTAGFFIYAYDVATDAYYGWWPQDLAVSNWNKPAYYGKIYMPEWTGVKDKDLGVGRLELLTRRTIFRKNLAITLNVPRKSKVTLQLIDIQGRVVKKATYELNRGTHTLHVAKDLRSGIYFIQVNTKDNTIRRKILVTR